FKFDIDTFRIEFGSFLALKGVGIHLDTGADADEELISFVSIGAELKVGPLMLGGEGRHFAFMGDGSFKAKPGFGVFLSVGSAGGGSVGWPSWLPIKITELGIEWADINTNPFDFILTLSASVDSIDGIPGATFSGTIDGVKIDLGRLFEGKFPIIDIASIGVSIEADLFGGTIKAGLIGGILKIDENNQMIGPTAPPDTPVKARIFFVGIEGGFMMMGAGGFNIKFALSELGPLGVQITASVPGGILLEPNTGLSINNFVGGVEFFSSLPDISEPEEMRRPEFQPAADVPAADWLPMVKQQVLDQYIAVQSNPNLGGFLAAFTSPMVITGGCQVFTLYASKETFNGAVQLKISTDGKIFIVGKLNFAADNISIAAKIYANLSKSAEGSATILFLAEIPEQIELLVIKGKFQMGFKGADGEPVEFTTIDPISNPKTGLSSPANNGDVGKLELNEQGYIDIIYTPSDGATLDDDSILDASSEFILLGEAASNVTILDTAVEKIDDTIFRYPFDGEFGTGDVDVEFQANSFADSEGKESLAETESFTLKEASAILIGPANGSAIDVTGLNDNKYILVMYVPAPGNQVEETSLDDADVVFTLTTPDGTTHDISGPGIKDGNAYRYDLPAGLVFTPGEVTVDFKAGTWLDKSGNSNGASSASFTVTGATASAYNPLENGAIDVGALNEQQYIEIRYAGGGGNALEEDTILDGEPEFSLSGTAADGVTIQDDLVEKINDTTFRYPFTGSFGTGEVEISYIAGSFSDATYFNIAETESFSILGPTAELDGEVKDRVIGFSTLDQQRYIDVAFTGTTGSSLDPASILDDDNELTFTMPDGSEAAPRGPPTQLDNNTFRYFLPEADLLTLEPGEVLVNFQAQTWTDIAGNSNLAHSAGFTIVVLTADLVDPLPQDKVDRANLNSRGYLLVRFNDVTGSGLDEESITDSEAEFTLTGEGSGTVAINGDAEKIEDGLFKYTFSGSFEDGLVKVNFLAGRWQDNTGNQSSAKLDEFAIISLAPSFEMKIGGAVELHAGGFTPDYDGDGKPDPLFSLRGEAILSTDIVLDVDTGEILEARMTLDLNATLELIWFGNVGSAAGRFILVTKNPFASANQTDSGSIFGPDTIQFWGVLAVQTNLEKLRTIGIEANAMALLMVNATPEMKIETISLEGIKGDELFTTPDTGISSELPANISPDSFTQVIPDDLRAAFEANGVEISQNLQVQGVEPGTRWKIIDNDAEGGGRKQYFVDKSGNTLHVYGEEQRFELEGYSFAIAAAGSLVFKIPPIQDDSPELFRVSGVFYMKISTAGLEVFVNAELTLGPEDNPFFRFDALGVLLINDDGFALQLELSLNLGSSEILAFEANFDLYVNISVGRQEFRVPNMFLDPAKGYLSQYFIDSLEFGTGDLLFTFDGSEIDRAQLNDGQLPDDLHQAFLSNGIALGGEINVRKIYKDSRWEIPDGVTGYVVEPDSTDPDTLHIFSVTDRFNVVIPRGPPQIDGTLGPVGYYIVIQAEGQLTIADVFKLQGFFRFELSVD
ncbi:MAG: hypothetical protein JRD68_08245, partial [Deltaproteobacteria bacterium]|nr:hypothetical protein [Deltaproteobacteria bacterium]